MTATPPIAPDAPLPALLWHFRHPRFWPVWALILMLRLIAWLPLPVIHAVSAVLGELLFVCAPLRRRVALRNLSACFPAESRQAIRRLARKHFRHFTYGVLSAGVSWWAPREHILSLVRMKNADHWRRLRKAGNNIILFMPHFTSLEFCGIYFSAIAPVTNMYRQYRNPLLDTLIRRYRQRFGSRLFVRQQAPHGLVRDIRKGRVGYYLSDQNARHGAVFANFFGIPTSTSLAPARLAALGRAALLPVGIRALPLGRGFDLFFLEPLELDAKQPEQSAKRINETLERLIQHAPEQYYWLHRKFKSRPPGAPPFYD